MPAARAAGRQAGRRSPSGGRQAGAQAARMQQRAMGRPTASQPAAGGAHQLSQGGGSGDSPQHGASHLADGRSSGHGPRQSHSAGGRSSGSLAAPSGPTKQGLSALQALLADAKATRSGRTSPALTSSGEVQDSGQRLAAPQAEQAGLLSGGSRPDSPASAMAERSGLLGDTSGLESPAADSSSSWQPGTNPDALHAALTAAADRAATGQAGSSATAATPGVGGHSLGQRPLQGWEQQGPALGPGQPAGAQPHSPRRGPVTGQSGVAGLFSR